MKKLIGKLLGNRYEILEQLGGGGMAIVYKGRDTILNRLVTIKVLRPEFTSDEDFVKRFRREAQAVASLSHPNIVSIYDVGRVDEVDYLVMEYIEGDNLKNLIRAHGPFTPAKAAQIARQISDALAHAHENKIVHRDVKPQNILMTMDGRAKLTDFGIARGATAATLTQTDTIMGSVHYLSPEQARGETTGPRSDIYSLGVVLYEMITGSLPFQGDTPVSVALKHIQDEPPRPSMLNPAVPLSLEKVVTRAMAKKPSGRYETAAQMSQELVDIGGTGLKESMRADAIDEFATRVIPTVHRAAGDGRAAGREERDERGRKRRFGWYWAALAVAGLLAAGVMAFQFYFNVPEVNMPSVVGKNIEEAKAILLDNNIKNIEVAWSNHPTVAASKVISQEPQADTRIKVTRSVVITVSRGAEQREVPSVIGYKLSDAINRINQSDLQVADPVQEKYSEHYAQGSVLEQDPLPGQYIAKGSVVFLSVSKGKQPLMCRVPDLTGLTVEKAKAELERLNLKLAQNISRAASMDYLAGQVIAQVPARNTEVEEGTEVQLTVSDGPGPVARTAKVTAFFDDKKEHELRIVVKDVRGTRDAFVGDYKNKESVVKEITYYGKATVQVYIDGVLKGEEVFE